MLLLAGTAHAQQALLPLASQAPYTPGPTSAAVAKSPDDMAQAPQQKPDQKQPLPGAPLPGGVRTAEVGLDLDQPAPYTIQLEAPSIYRVAISVESDAQLKERIRQENRERKTPERIGFPNDPVISTEKYGGRKWHPMRLEVAPYYVCHGRVSFQQLNFERYGWDLGLFGPLVSAGTFFYDFVMWPYHIFMEPERRIEYNTGWCLPGDPVPLMLYPFQLSATGFAAEVGTIIALVVCFP